MFTNAKMTLCNSHDTIKYWSREIRKKLKRIIKDKNYSMLDELFPLLTSILEETRVAKKKGQRMESRLKAYHASIIKLGFRRIGRN